MTTFLLIRHGLTDAVGHHLTGRLPGVYLNDTGRRQAEGLGARLRPWNVTALYASPLERTQETAGPVARDLGLPVGSSPGAMEFDFGDWSGMTLEDLGQREDWLQFNRLRGSTRAPGGEHFLEVQARMAAELARLAALHPGGTIALISHADAIKAAMMFALGMPADYIHRLEISPASINVVQWEVWGPLVLGVNLGAGPPNK